MKKADLAEIKNLTIAEVIKRSAKLRQELEVLAVDKNMGKLKDVKSLWKIRKSLAQVLTIARQKELLARLTEDLKKKVKS